MKLIHKMPIAAAVLGLVLVFSQSAFKTSNKATDSLYGKMGNGTWVNIDNIPQDGNAPYEHNSYRCELSLENCTVISPTPPKKGANFPGATLGEYIYTP